MRVHVCDSTIIQNILKIYHTIKNILKISQFSDSIDVPGAYYSLRDTDNLNEISFSRHLRKSLLVSQRVE